jgi:dihydrofolate reductase
MRLVRFGGAVSLDGYIAGPNGEYDWIVTDPEIDFAAMMKRYDTFLIGRKTLDVMRRMGSDAQKTPGIQNIIFSRTLRPADFPNIRIEDDAVRVVRELRGQPGKTSLCSVAGSSFEACSPHAWSITSRSP